VLPHAESSRSFDLSSASEPTAWLAEGPTP
jgi:hypothetical protein